MTYIPGDYHMICDRCGGKFRRSEMQKTWEGYWVDSKCFNVRHPQDFVKNIRDKQSVPVARPDRNSSLGETTLFASSAKFANSITLTSTSYIIKYSSLGITLDDGTVQWTFATADPAAGVVQLNDQLWGPASSGNIIFLGDNVGNETFLTTLLTGDDL